MVWSVGDNNNVESIADCYVGLRPCGTRLHRNCAVALNLVFLLFLSHLKALDASPARIDSFLWQLFKTIGKWREREFSYFFFFPFEEFVLFFSFRIALGCWRKYVTSHDPSFKEWWFCVCYVLHKYIFNWNKCFLFVSVSSFFVRIREWRHREVVGEWQ